MYDALYARQSVEKVDSISIESQLEYCRHEARGNPCREYIDRGYSGKNTNRPAFEQLLADVRQGKVARVIVYKLDRISRSILDFANMMQLFQQHRVEFVSSTERFDTSTPIGRAMLHICIVFAQLERETIQKRVTDAYYSRCKTGLYMGGRVPYGFARQQTMLDGVRTSMFVPVPQEARQVQLIYSLYADPANSLGDLVRYLNAHGHKQLRGGMWSTARLSEMLRNPVYVRADAAVYDFFKEQGAQLLNPAADFTGYNGCYLYKGAGGEGRSPSDLSGREVVLAPHEGLVSSRDWLRCRLRCQQNRRSTTTCKAKSSWLLGKVKCGRCGYGLSVVKSDTRWQRYFVCSAALASKKQRCPGTGGRPMCRRKSKGGWAFLISSASGRSRSLTESATSSASALPRSSGRSSSCSAKSAAPTTSCWPTSTAGWPSSMRSAASCRQRLNGWRTRRTQRPSVTPRSSGQRPALRKNRRWPTR